MTKTSGFYNCHQVPWPVSVGLQPHFFVCFVRNKPYEGIFTKAMILEKFML